MNDMYDWKLILHQPVRMDLRKATFLNDEEYEIKILMPGVKKSELDVKISKSMLSVEIPEKSEYVEAGKFAWDLNLLKLDYKKIKVVLERGILSIKLSVKKEEKLKEVEVN